MSYTAYVLMKRARPEICLGMDHTVHGVTKSQEVAKVWCMGGADCSVVAVPVGCPSEAGYVPGLDVTEYSLPSGQYQPGEFVEINGFGGLRHPSDVQP